MSTDKQLTCTECQRSFTFTAGEQEFFRQKGFTNEPKRCRECRSKRQPEKREKYGSARNQSRR